MTLALTITMTAAGLARFTAAQLGDAIDLSISSVGLTDAVFVVAPTLDALPGEFRRLDTVSGEAVGNNIVHMTMRDEAAVGYTARGFGLFLADGTLFAVYGQADLLFEKSPLTTFLAAIDIAFPTADIDRLTFGNANFVNPPATETTPGVARIASDADVAAGTNDSRYVTPKRLFAQLVSALADYIPLTAKGAANGVATLSADGFVPAEQSRVWRVNNKSGDVRLNANDVGAAPVERSISGTGLAKLGGRLDVDREIRVDAASPAQIRDGVAQDVAITPAGLAAAGGVFIVEQTLAYEGGHRVWSDGLKECWGFVGVPANAVATVVMPVAHSSFIAPTGAPGAIAQDEQMVGHLTRGVGAARYAYDPEIDAAYVAAHPRTAFLSKNGRGFAINETVVDPLMTGAEGGALDDTDAVQAAIDTGRDTIFTQMHTVVALRQPNSGVSMTGSGGLRSVTGVDGQLLRVDGNANLIAFSKAIGFNNYMTGSIAGTTLTVVSASDTIRPHKSPGVAQPGAPLPLPGTPLSAEGLEPGTCIVEQLTGPAGGPGTYRLNKPALLSEREIRAIDRLTFNFANDIVYVTGDDNTVAITLIDGSAGGGVAFQDGASNNLMVGMTVLNVYDNSLIIAGANTNGNAASDCKLIGTIAQNNIFVSASAGSADSGDWLDGVTFTNMTCLWAGDTGIELGYHVRNPKIFGGVIRYSNKPCLLFRDCRGAVVVGTTCYAREVATQDDVYNIVAVVPHHEGADFDYSARIAVKTIGAARQAGVYVGGRGVDLTGSDILAFTDGRTPPTSAAALIGSGVVLAGDVADFTMMGGAIDGFAINMNWNQDARRTVRRNCHVRNVRSTTTRQHLNLFNLVPVNSSYVNNYGDRPTDLECKLAAAVLAPASDYPAASFAYFGNSFIAGPLSSPTPPRFDPYSDAVLQSTDSALRGVPSAQYAPVLLAAPALPGSYVASILGTSRVIIFDVIGTRTIKRGGSDDMNDETGFGLRFYIENGALIAKQYAPDAPANQAMKIAGPGIAASI